MQLCKGPRRNEHTEVCFEDGEECPVCKLVDLLDKADDRVLQLEDEISGLENAAKEAGAY